MNFCNVLNILAFVAMSANWLALLICHAKLMYRQMVLLAGEFAESCYVRSVIEQFMHSKHPNLRLVYFAQPR